MTHRILLVAPPASTAPTGGTPLEKPDAPWEIQVLSWEQLDAAKPEPTLIFAPAPGEDAVARVRLEQLRARYPGVPLQLFSSSDSDRLPATPAGLMTAASGIVTAADLQSVSNLHTHLFDDSPSPMWLYDRKTLRFLFVNRAAVRAYGYSREEFLEQLTVLDIRPEEDRAAFLTGLHKGFSGEDFYNGSWRHRRRDGSVFYTKVYSQDSMYQGVPCRMVLAIDIQEQHLAQSRNESLSRQVAAQKQALDDTLNSIRDIVWSVDLKEQRLRYVNKACQAIVGYTPDELCAGTPPLTGLILPDDHPLMGRYRDELLQKGMLETTYRVLAKDGTIRYLASHTTVQYDADGAPRMINGVDSDITAQYLAETARQHTAQELQTVLESITDGFVTLDRDWNFTFVNREFERVCRMPREDVLGRNYWDIFPKALDLKFYTEYQRAVRDRVSVHFEEYASSFSAWIRVTAHPTDTGLTIYFHDTTQEKALQDRIRHDEENLKALIDNTDDLIWSVDPECRLLTSNEAFTRTYAQILGHPIAPGESLLQPAHHNAGKIDRWRSYYERAFRGEIFTILDTLEHPDGMLQHNDIQFRPIRNADGVTVGAGIFSRDITQQLRYQQAIEQQNERLRRIAWIQSHEVRGPLASILGSVEVLSLTDATEPHTRDELLEGLRDAAQRLDRVIRDIDHMTGSGPIC